MINSLLFGVKSQKSVEMGWDFVQDLSTRVADANGRAIRVTNFPRKGTLSYLRKCFAHFDIHDEHIHLLNHPFSAMAMYSAMVLFPDRCSAHSAVLLSQEKSFFARTGYTILHKPTYCSLLE